MGDVDVGFFVYLMFLSFFLYVDFMVVFKWGNMNRNGFMFIGFFWYYIILVFGDRIYWIMIIRFRCRVCVVWIKICNEK